MNINSQKNIVILLAAGNGLRMNSDIPKQYLDMNGKKIYSYSLDEIMKNPKIDLIILVVNYDHFNFYKNIKNEYLDKRLILIEGGKTRFYSFLKAIEYLKNNNININSKIITHDIVRPFVSNDMINDHIDLLDKYDIVNTVIPIYDSIIFIKKNYIQNYLDRNSLYLVQTPQSFIFNKFFSLDFSIIDENEITDICYIFFKNNFFIFNYIGNKRNIKITSSDDLFENKLV